MKPDVKKIIADIKATKGNRKFCNGLAGTLQDDNYASSICKYVKTVTPERIDLLIEYAEKLEAEVTDMAVQLANAESKCRALAAENSGMNVFIEEECFVYSSDTPEPIDANDCKPKTPATDTFLAEVRAQGVEMFADFCGEENSVFVEAKAYYRSLPDAVAEFAAQLRKGAAL
ncbi:hypothetical protein ABI309_09015 [Citrobacter youngae]|uniref:hypothetical protein n=1 Tax=Citrobacter TaxID=544 RepID=UPI001C0E4F64|nr:MULTISPECIES: hypothetical protein [Citrobacter]MBU3800486.1 hypothetical protein [Citrobacter youngae]MDM2719462.1 hypothetical protein [Citrobacter sp. Cy232]MDM2723554.1 hypothetical protein [Citrobacter sp. Cy230]